MTREQRQEIEADNRKIVRLLLSVNPNNWEPIKTKAGFTLWKHTVIRNHYRITKPEEKTPENNHGVSKKTADSWFFMFTYNRE